eukprot:gene4425-4678_t
MRVVKRLVVWQRLVPLEPHVEEPGGSSKQRQHELPPGAAGHLRPLGWIEASGCVGPLGEACWTASW